MAAASYSAARRAGDLLFVSGQLALIDGALVEGDIREQTQQALENLAAVLSEHGASRDDVVKCQVFLASMTDWPAMNEVYGAFFGQPYPARSAIGVDLIPGALVEIEAVAWVGRG